MPNTTFETIKRIIKAIVFFLAACWVILWAKDAYYRAEDPNLIPHPVPLNETNLQWGVRVSTSMIYWMSKDVVSFSTIVLDYWHSRLPPIYRLGSLVFLALITSNMLYSMRERRRRKMYMVYCEIHDTNALPIPGSYNRYYCQKGHHQFTDDVHRI